MTKAVYLFSLLLLALGASNVALGAEPVKEISLGPKQYTASALVFDGYASKVQIKGHDKPYIQVTQHGRQDVLAHLKVDVHDDAIRFTTPSKPMLANQIAIKDLQTGLVVEGVGNVTVNHDGQSISVTSHSNGASQTRTIILMPKGLPLQARDVIADMEVEGADGRLDLSIARADISVAGKIPSADISLDGEGSVYLKNAPEKLDIILSGSGDIFVGEGQIQSVSIESSGAGDIDINANVINLIVKNSGAGDVRVQKVQNVKENSNTGAGDVYLSE